MYIGISVLKSYPVTCLNRDEVGTPKVCVFGGTERGRISSQNLKYTIRKSEMFADVANKYGGTALKTRGLIELLNDALEGKCEPDKKAAIMSLAEQLYAYTKETKPVRVFARSEIKALSEKILTWAEEKSMEELESLKEKYIAAIGAKKSKNSDDKAKSVDTDAEAAFSVTAVYGTLITPDIAMFGRMLEEGSKDGKGTEGAVCVAHAISTHTVAIQQDFFSAVDDILKGGAAHLSNLDFDSACYYEFFAVDTNQLLENLSYIKEEGEKQEAARELVRVLVKCIAACSSKSRQHSMAGMPVPSAILVEMRNNNANFSYANAFETPIKYDQTGGYIRSSVETLRNYVAEVNARFDLFAPEKRLWLTDVDGISFNDGVTLNCRTLSEVLSQIEF